VKTHILSDNSTFVMTRSGTGNSVFLYQFFPNMTLNANAFGAGQRSLNVSSLGSVSSFAAPSFLSDSTVLIAATRSNASISEIGNVAIPSLARNAISDPLLHFPQQYSSDLVVDPSRGRIYISASVFRGVKRQFALAAASSITGQLAIQDFVSPKGLFWSDDVWTPSEEITLDSLTVDPDGSIVYGATAYSAIGVPTVYVSRRNADGVQNTTLAPAYAAAIKSKTPKIVRLPNGKYFVISNYNQNPSYLSVSRLLPDLSIDPTFSINFTMSAQAVGSIQQVVYYNTTDSVYAIGTGFVTGAKYCMIAKFNSSQLPDLNFGYQGIIFINYDTFYPVECTSIVFVPNEPDHFYFGGKVVTDFGATRMILGQVNAVDGSPLPWLDLGAYLLYAQNMAYSEVVSLEWDPDAKRIVVIGLTTQPFATRRVTIMRLNPINGLLDCFGNTDGLVMLDQAFLGVSRGVYSDGSYYVAVNDALNFRVMKYNANGWPACGSGCGNGVVDPGESCDDGNVADGDGCSSACILSSGWTCPVPGTGCVSLFR
jgi:cysteine-rich repeat protein